MAFGSSEVIRADVEFRANTVGFTGDMTKIRAEAERTFGALDSTTLKAALASEKYDRALARSKGSTFAIAKATAAYKAELASLEGTQTRATADSHRHSNALQQEERSLQQMARGALVGSGALGRYGRAAVFATSSVLGGYGLAYAIRSTISAAREQQVALAHAQVAVNDSGLSWRKYGRDIREALDAQIKATGFTDNELTESFAAFVRRFGDVNTALKANAIAADVARAKNISLADAQTLVMRASFGNPRSLRILGIELTKTTSNMDALKASTKHATDEQIAAAKAADLQANELNALDAVRAKYHGNAARYLQTDAGKQALFNAELDKSKEIIGGGLLPVFNKLLTAGTTYLEHLNSTGELQRKVNHVVDEGGHVVHGLADAYQLVAPPIRLANRLLGGTEHSARLVAIAFAAMKLGLLPSLFRAVGIGIRGVGTQASVAAGELNLMAAAEARAAAGGAGIPLVFGKGGPGLVGRIGEYGNPIPPGGMPGGVPTGGIPILGALALGFFGSIPDQYKGGIPTVDGGKLMGTPPKPGSRVKRNGIWFRVYYTADGKIGWMPEDAIGSQNATPGDKLNPRINVPGSPAYVPPAKRGGAGGKKPPIVVGLTNAQQTPLLEAQGTTSTADDIAALKNELAILDKQLNQDGLSAEQRNEILSERNQALSQLQGINSDAARTAAEAERKRREAAKRARAEILKQRRKRLTSLTEAPVDLRIQEATARAHKASEETLVKILEEEKRAIEKQVETLKKIGAGKDYILKARKNEATIQSKIDTLLKKKKSSGTTEQQGFIDSLSGILGQFASDVGIGSKSGETKVINVNVDQRGQEVSAWAAARAAREAAMHLL